MIKFIHPKRAGKKASRAQSALIGQVVEGEICDLAADGRGVLRREGQLTLLVAGAWPGETVRARVTGVKKQAAFAVLEQVLNTHPERQAPPCPYHGHDANSCGGCPWMYMAYPAQAAAKTQRVHQAMQALGVPSARCRALRQAPEPLHYRRRAQLKTDGRILGFLAAGTHSIKDIDHCRILTPAAQVKLNDLRAQLPNPAWQPRARQFTTIDISESDVSVARRLPFQQTNDRQNGFMQQWLGERLSGTEDLKILELFAGSGNFTRVLAAPGHHRITACDAVAEATASLEALRLAKVAVTTADLFDERQVDRLASSQSDSQMLVLDPPREGFKLLPQLLDRLPRLEQLIYISCDLATFCRDATAVLARGFICTEVQPVDPFAQTPHLEILAHFQRSGQGQ